MNRTARDRTTSPHPAPVKKVQLSEKHTTGRLIAAVLLGLFGAALLAHGFLSYLRTDSGWQEISASSDADINCADEFVFQYDVGAGEQSAIVERKALVTLYTSATVKAYQLFNNDKAFDGINNIYSINTHPNEVLEVDEVLYHAFEQVQEYKNRYVYLAPAYDEYDSVFYCADDSEIVNYSPAFNADVAEEFAQIAAFAGDEKSVELQLLGNHQVQLYVSDEYLAYAKENAITDFIDFYWMKNAFIIDYFAEVLTENGFTNGFLSSYDGFVRNLDERETTYSYNLFDRQEDTIYPAAVMQYSGGISLVYLRNYPMNKEDYRHYYEMKDGNVLTPYLSILDGQCKSALNDLFSYSYKVGCAEILLQTMPAYIANALDEGILSELKKNDIYYSYCKNRVIFYDDTELVLTDLYEKDNVSYKAKLN